MPRWLQYLVSPMTALSAIPSYLLGLMLILVYVLCAVVLLFIGLFLISVGLDEIANPRRRCRV